MNRTQSLKKPLMRSLFFSVGLWILSIIFLSPRAVSAPLQVAHNTSVPPSTIAQAVAMTLPSQIFRRWTHSREEDQGDILVYRFSDYPFPPARGREGLEFRENGEFILYQIGSTDRSLAVPGQWSLHGTNVVAVQFPDQSTSSYTLTILECSEQILKVRQTVGNPSQ
jgi:hypothetical protein